ncbi:Zinc finger, GRF-type [Sesbania bispinosa]|nr:Zinc finger, GRF-type [Sesbania bispinosa]
MILKSLSVGGSSEMKIQKMLGDISNTQPYSFTHSIQNLRSEIEEKERETMLLPSNPTDDSSLICPLPQALLERLKNYGQEEVIVLWEELSLEERDLFVKKIKSLDLSRIDRIIRCFLRSRPTSQLFGDEEVQLWKPFRDKLETIMVMLDKRYIDDSNFTWFRDTHKVFDNLSERLTVNVDVLQMWVLISNFKLAYNLLRRPDGTFNRDLAELLDRNVSTNTNPVDGVFSFDVIVDRETNLLTRIYRPAEGEKIAMRALENRYPCAYEDEKRLDGRYFVRVQDRDCHQNPVELDRLKKAHIRDGASIVHLREKEAETQDFIGAVGASGFVKVAMKTKSYGVVKRSAACKSSSSSSIARRHYCACGEEVTLLKSNSVRNPGRIFWRCPNWDKEKNCGYFRWADDEASEQRGRLDDMEFIGQEQEQLKRKIGKLQLKLTVERRKVMVAECCVILCVAVNLVGLLLCIVKCDRVRKNV